jgi:putative colanic acid biosysnthesis UDP-glucose lipid carrier transferase
MKFRLSNYVGILFAIKDLIILNISFLIGFYYRFGNIDNILDTRYNPLILFVNFAWILLALTRKYNIQNRRIELYRVISSYLTILTLHFLFTLSFVTIVKGHYYSREFILAFYISLTLLGFSARLLITLFIKYYRKKGFNYRRVVVAGINQLSVDFVHEIIHHSEYGYKFLGFFDDEEDNEWGIKSMGKIDDLNKFVLEYDIDDIYISLPVTSDYRIWGLIKFCNINYINVKFINQFIHLLNRKTVQVDVDYSGPTPILSIKKEPLEVTTNKIFKRAFDIIFSFFVITLVFSWLFPILAVLIKMGSKGSVFFIQKRSGIDNKEFNCMKFRTMVVNNESDTKQATSNDPRITKMGRFLRASNFDELPQFFNVLMGDMSVVGPRPHMVQHTYMYSKLIEPFMVRHWVKPGITGLAQAKGFRGETKDINQMLNRVKMDIFYIQNWSLSFDFKIIFQTGWNMINNTKTGA